MCDWRMEAFGTGICVGLNRGMARVLGVTSGMTRGRGWKQRKVIIVLALAMTRGMPLCSNDVRMGLRRSNYK